MQVITKQEIANEAKDHWKIQYFKNGEWYDSNKEMIYNHLVLLGNSPAPSLVNQVIGNSSWTHLGCSECHADVDEAVLFGVVGYEGSDSEYCYLCRDCFAKALGLF